LADWAIGLAVGEVLVVVEGTAGAPFLTAFARRLRRQVAQSASEEPLRLAAPLASQICFILHDN